MGRRGTSNARRRRRRPLRRCCGFHGRRLRDAFTELCRRRSSAASKGDRRTRATDHGRSAHRLADQWRTECKKAKELGQKPPVPPQQLKKQQAAAARKALAASGLGNPPPNPGQPGAGSESDSDAAAAEREAEAEEEKEEAPAPKEEAVGNRPSFLAV